MRAHIARARALDEDFVGLMFDYDVPDHLPGSPLCPLDARHKYGGNSICPLHGRKKDAIAAKDKANKAEAKRLSLGTQAQARREPEIVFDSSPAISP